MSGSDLNKLSQDELFEALPNMKAGVVLPGDFISLHIANVPREIGVILLLLEF